jgi:2-amino-4-hydroxy-6-hydroxymethyldihydropteridine diphosphokinase
MTEAYIGIGANLGEPARRCLEAVERMGRVPRTRVKAVSPWYRSRPVGVEDQDWYVNGVALLETGLGAGELLERLLGIEADMGRVRKERWEARVIDLDLLLFGRQRISEPDLTVPHPRMHLRRFVLTPLADLAPDLIHPVLGKGPAEFLAGIDEHGQEMEPMEDD